MEASIEFTPEDLFAYCARIVENDIGTYAFINMTVEDIKDRIKIVWCDKFGFQSYQELCGYGISSKTRALV